MIGAKAITGCQVIQVIVTDLKRRGRGTQESIIRLIRQCYTLDGELLFESDPCPHYELMEEVSRMLDKAPQGDETHPDLTAEHKEALDMLFKVRSAIRNKDHAP